LEGNETVIGTARVAYTFKQDPAAMLEGRPIDWLVRLASHNIIMADKEKAAKEADRKANQ
jgi:hypothetical protein